MAPGIGLSEVTVAVLEGISLIARQGLAAVSSNAEVRQAITSTVRLGFASACTTEVALEVHGLV